MNIADRQAIEELTVFKRFAGVCPLSLRIDLLTETDISRPEPELDILCKLESGESLAFELVQCEDVTNDDAHPGKPVPVTKKLMDAITLRDALYRTCIAAAEAGCIESPERFENHSVTVNFHDQTSCTQRVKAAPRVVKLLNQRGPGRHAVKDGVIWSIHCKPVPVALQTVGPPTFHVRSGCGARPYIVERVEKKLAKRYESNCNIHLLAWSTTAREEESILWRDRLVDLLKFNGMGPFDRIWVFGYGVKTIVFDSTASLK